MDAIYFKIIALVLLFPWALLALALVGYLRARPRRSRLAGRGSAHKS